MKTSEDSFTVDALVGGNPVHTMLDTGATENFISWKSVRQLGLRYTLQESVVELADGSTTKSTAMVVTAIEVAGKSCRSRFTVLDGMDGVVLGLPWLEATSPRIDWSAKSVSF